MYILGSDAKIKSSTALYHIRIELIREFVETNENPNRFVPKPSISKRDQSVYCLIILRVWIVHAVTVVLVANSQDAVSSCILPTRI